jgi:septal ring factor EnvC (AmiA/AmiB activator)
MTTPSKPAHCQLRSVVNDIKDVQKKMVCNMACIAMYAQEKEHSSVIEESDRARQSILTDLIAVRGKMEVAITSAASQRHQLHDARQALAASREEVAEGRKEIDQLKKKLEEAHDEELSFTQALNQISHNTETQKRPGDATVGKNKKSKGEEQETVGEEKKTHTFSVITLNT